MAVFGVKYRLGLIDVRWANRLYALIGKILSDIEGVKPVKINGFVDHVHVLYSTRGTIADSEIVRRIKSDSSKWINKEKLTTGRFAWQEGCARISCSPSGLSRLKSYIESQWVHHKKTSFREEYARWLNGLGVIPGEYDLPADLE